MAAASTAIGWPVWVVERLLPVPLAVAILAVPVAVNGLPEVGEVVASTAVAAFVGLTLAWCWLRGRVSLPGGLVLVPAGLVACVAWWQTWELPAGTVASWSPRAAALRAGTQQLLDAPAPVLPDRDPTLPLPAPLRPKRTAPDPYTDPASAEEGGPPRRKAESTISLAPEATRQELGRMLMALLFLAAVLAGPSDRAHLRRVLMTLAVIGAVFGAVTILHARIGHRAIFWLGFGGEGGSAGAGATYAATGNRNRMAGMLCVCLGAALGLVLELVLARRRDGLSGGSRRDPDQPPPRDRLFAWGPAAVLMAAAVPISLSRGATLAMAGALLATAAMLLLRRGARRAVAVPALAAALLLLLVGWWGWDDVSARLSTLTDARNIEAARLALWRDVLSLWEHHPDTGVGFGAFRHAFPEHLTLIGGGGVFRHAENDYLELLAEGGRMAAVPAAIALLMILRAVWSCAGAAATGHGGATGTGFAVVALLLCVAGDFGFHGPSNLWINLLAIGLCVQQGRLHRAAMKAAAKPDIAIGTEAGAPGPASGEPAVSRLPGGRLAVLAAAAAAGWVIGGVLPRQAASAEAARNATAYQAFAKGRLAGPVDEFRRAASAAAPEDGRLQLRLGATAYRLAPDEFGPHRASAEGPIYRAAERHLRRAIAACPTEPRALLGLGRLYMLMADPRAEAFLRAAIARGPTDGEPHLYLGRLLLSQGRAKEALRAYVRGAELEYGSYEHVLLKVLPALCRHHAEVLDWKTAFSPVDSFANRRIRRLVAGFLDKRDRRAEADLIRPPPEPADPNPEAVQPDRTTDPDDPDRPQPDGAGAP